jgi:hypothetical protein
MFPILICQSSYSKSLLFQAVCPAQCVSRNAYAYVHAYTRIHTCVVYTCIHTSTQVHAYTCTHTLPVCAGTGQPNYYVARGRRPTLADYDFRDITAGATATIRTSRIFPGVYVVGVQAYCCVGATSLATLIMSGPTNCGNGVIDSGTCFIA